MKKRPVHVALITLMLGCVGVLFWFRAQQNQIYEAAITSEVSNRFGPIVAPHKRLFFVRIDGADAPATVLATLSNQLAKFRPISQAVPVATGSAQPSAKGNGIFKDRQTGEKGILLDFSAIRWQLHKRKRNLLPSVIATILVHERPQLQSSGASSIECQLAYEGGRWTVTDREGGINDWTT